MKHSKAYICDVCRKKFPFDNIRYSIDGKRILCTECHSQIMENKASAKRISIPAAKEPSESVKLLCLDCNYHFSIRKGSKVRLRCPYCGNSRLARDNMTAEKLIEEVSHMK